MASRYYGLNRGQRAVDIVEGSSTGSKSVEIAIDLAHNMTRSEVLQAIEYIKGAITEDTWPPA